MYAWSVRMPHVLIFVCCSTWTSRHYSTHDWFHVVNVNNLVANNLTIVADYCVPKLLFEPANSIVANLSLCTIH
jgi:hypothetical protein